MSADEILSLIDEFLNQPRAKRICRRYRAEPDDARSELYLRAAPLLAQGRVRNASAWSNKGLMGFLRNYLRREYLTWR